MSTKIFRTGIAVSAAVAAGMLAFTAPAGADTTTPAAPCTPPITTPENPGVDGGTKPDGPTIRVPEGGNKDGLTSKELDDILQNYVDILNPKPDNGEGNTPVGQIGTGGTDDSNSNNDIVIHIKKNDDSNNYGDVVVNESFKFTAAALSTDCGGDTTEQPGTGGETTEQSGLGSAEDADFGALFGSLSSLDGLLK
ncbi:hypothetical protein [Prescottella subtropica]|uniref:hypothetical protein n=1 Tax=Prescottella subtropica TaxID=2545757 RepID=UPI0010F7AAA2|nr:hypothetical protein [Prescottella subtropica]